MSDGIKRMYEDAYAAAFNQGVAKIDAKSSEEIYTLLKDLQSELQQLHYDDSLQLTRSQWACLSRMNTAMRELMA